jgi:hypothetical protein
MDSTAIAVRPKAIWRRALRVLATLLIVGVVVFWAAKGAHRGWTQNQVPVIQTDPITGIEFPTYEDRFVPGVDILGGGVALGLVLLGISFVGSRRS